MNSLSYHESHSHGPLGLPFQAFSQEDPYGQYFVPAISRIRIKNTSTMPVMVTTTSKPKSMVFLLFFRIRIRPRGRQQKINLEILYLIFQFISIKTDNFSFCRFHSGAWRNRVRLFSLLRPVGLTGGRCGVLRP